MSRILSLAFVLAAAVHALAADDAYTLKLYKDKEGDVTKKTKVAKTDGTVKFAIGDMKGDAKQKASEDVAYTEEILKMSADAKKPTKFQRIYEKVNKTNERGEEVKSYLVGKTVVIDRRNDKPVYTVDGKEPTEDQQKELDAEFNKKSDDMNKHDLMPDKAVKVGDTWQIDKKKVLTGMGEWKGFAFDEEKSSFSGKLVKAAKKDGALHGTIEFTLKFALTEFPLDPNMSAPTEAGSEMSFKVMMDACLDGTVPGEKVEMTMKMAVKAKLPMDGKLDADVTVTGTDTEEPAKKK